MRCEASLYCALLIYPRNCSSRITVYLSRRVTQYTLAFQFQKLSDRFRIATVISCNIGNPQELGQKPLSFPRQVLSLLTCPQLLDNPAVRSQMPSDVTERALRYKSRLPGGTGQLHASCMRDTCCTMYMHACECGVYPICPSLCVLVLVCAIGAYSNSQGIDVVREEVAKFLHERDGYPR